MTRKNIKLAVSTLVVGIFLGIGSIAYAAYATSPYGYYGPFLGYSYRNRASVGVSEIDRVYAGTWVENSDYDSGQVPTGYMGSQARLFKNDALYVYTSMIYNDKPLYGMDNVVSAGESFLSATYYSKGISAAYNGNGYSNYYTFQSPSINH